MAENQPQPGQTNAIKTNRNRLLDPLTRPVPNRLAATVQHAGSACLNIVARPNTAVPLIFTCVCIALAYKNRRLANNIFRRPRGRYCARAEPIRPVLQRSMSIAVLHGGQLALQRIIDAQEARLNDPNRDQAEVEFQKLLDPSDGRIHFSKLQSVAGKLEMSGKEDEAVAMLRQAMKKAQPHEAHEIGMLLVEMLIYKGDYDEALRCHCLYDEGITDARGALYKAILYSLKGDDRTAEENYKRFQDIRNQLHWPDPFNEASLYTVIDFNNFQTIVKNLKKEIEKVERKTP